MERREIVLVAVRSKFWMGRSWSDCLAQEVLFLSPRSLPPLSGGLSGDRRHARVRTRAPFTGVSQESRASSPAATGSSSWRLDESLRWLPLGPYFGWVGHGATALPDKYPSCHLALFRLCRTACPATENSGRPTSDHRAVAHGASRDCVGCRSVQILDGSVVERLPCPRSILLVTSFSSVFVGRPVRRQAARQGAHARPFHRGFAGVTC